MSQPAGGGDQARAQAGESRFRAVVDGFGDPILILDSYQIVRYANRQFMRDFGLAPAEVIGRALDELLPPEERDAAAERLEAVGDGPAGAVRFEHRLVRKDGWSELVETTANRLEDPSGHATVILHMRLVTERREAERRLRESEERYRRLVENSHDLVQSVDIAGRLTFVNRAWLETLGYGAGEAAGAPLADVLHPDSRERSLADLAALLADGGTRHVSMTLVTRGGAAVDLEGAAVLQGQGDAAAASFYLRDVTEQRQHMRVQGARYAMSRILAESPEPGEALAGALVAIAATLDWQAAELWAPAEPGGPLARRFEWHTPGDTRLDEFAAASSEPSLAPGKGLPELARARAEVVWVDDLGEAEAFRRKQLAARAGLKAAVAIPVLRGAEAAAALLCFSRSSRPVDPELAGALADLGRQLGQFAARKEAEAELRVERESLARRVEERTADLSRLNAELAQAVRAKDEFLANMSHELRTPLNAILALSETLLEQFRGPLNDHQQSAVRGIETSGRHLLALINDILDLAKVEAGRLDLDLEVVQVAEVCQASLAFVRELALRKQLQLGFQLNDQLAELRVDQRRLKQILVNLLSNAVKFTPEGGRVTLEVDVRPAEGAVHFAVRDTGLGIAPADLARLFRPFTQVDSSIRRQHEGTGLGLALVRRLAELHGGGVSVESEVGRGSRFVVSLPHSAQAAQPAAAPAAAPAHARGGRGMALVIDDSESAAGQISHYLESMNMAVVVHPTGAGAVEQAVRLQPDVVLLDLMLDDSSGWEILAGLRADPRTADIPVIIASVVDEHAKGLAAGAAAYLVKPLSREEVRRALRAAGLGDAQPAPAPPAPAPPPAAAPGARVLLAEDNETSIEVMAEFLEHRGYRLTIARNGREAVERAAETDPDIILMDIQMPELDGLEAMRRLRASPRLAETPIVALTALAMPGDRERCLAAGADEYLTKPVSLRQLGATIEGLLRR